VGGQGEVGTGVRKWFAAGSGCGRCGHSFRQAHRSDSPSPTHASSGSGPHHHQHHYGDDVDGGAVAAGAAAGAAAVVGGGEGGVVAAAAVAVANRHCKAEVGTAGSRRRRAAGQVTFQSAWCDMFVSFIPSLVHSFIHSLARNGGCHSHFILEQKITQRH